MYGGKSYNNLHTHRQSKGEASLGTLTDLGNLVRAVKEGIITKRSLADWHFTFGTWYCFAFATVEAELNDSAAEK